MKDSDKDEIIYLYFSRMYSYSKLQEHFNNKYTYAELKGVISKHLKEENK